MNTEQITKQEIEAIIDRLAINQPLDGQRAIQKYTHVTFFLLARWMLWQCEENYNVKIPVDQFEIEEIIRRPILLGDVLNAIEIIVKSRFGNAPLKASYPSTKAIQYEWEYWFHSQSSKLLKHWVKIGLKASLQGLYAKMKFENVATSCPDGKKGCLVSHTVQVALPSPATDLFIFLKNLGL